MAADRETTEEQITATSGNDFFDRQTGRFFRKIDWVAFWTTFLISLGLYVYTLAPAVTLEDSGELAVASDYLGVPHPPGYPIWTLLSWFFQWIFHWVTYYGQPNPAWSIGLMSAFFGALTCGIVALLVSRSGADLLSRITSLNKSLGRDLICWTGAVSAGLLLACSPGLWSQSVIVEVYSLNSFFTMIIMLLTYMWISRPKEHVLLLLAAFFFGLGLTNHQTLIFVGLALAAAVFFRDVNLFRDFLTVGVLIGALIAINIFAKKFEHPDLLWANGPRSTAFWVYTILFVLIPIIAYFVLPNGKVVGPTFLMVGLGISFYLYLPFASEGNPPMNWAYPRTWNGFLHSITRGQYEKIALSNIFGDPARFMGQLGAFARDLRSQYTVPIALMGALPFTAWSISLKGRRINFFYIGCACLVVSTLFALTFKMLVPEATLAASEAGGPGGLLSFLSKTYKISGLLLFLLASVGCLDILIRYIRREVLQGGPAAGLLIFILAVALAGVVYLDIQLLRLFLDIEAAKSYRFLYFMLIAGPPALCALVWWMVSGPLSMENEIDENSGRWIMVTLAGFIGLSLVLVIFLNHKLDIQTQFIGRVQLIQAHGVYALWIGYGLIFLLSKIETTLRRPGVATYPGLALVAVLPTISLLQNAYDEDRLRIIGGVEQNGHDFGWQFGNYQLRGINAILEEYDPKAKLLCHLCDGKGHWVEQQTAEPPAGAVGDIETKTVEVKKECPRCEGTGVFKNVPPPSKTYPPEMGTNAVFFGGTDPGRFVPTYMIYSAKVRPDVFLITQNALADNTYMNVMRDLYGDEIWIPAQQDSNAAFQQYVNDVNAGRIQAGAALNVKDGRVSVQGVQGVMIINGILARMIFDSNKYKHDFYVEESYVIPWMYAYLSPHGLIMKINKDPISITSDSQVTQDDRAFWDWYADRLLGNRKFTRDVVARKTFSKLRSAIAGIYAYRRMFAEAEYAFRQAIDLYPLSPEANFRLADIYMQQRRFKDARKLISALYKGDPGNDKVRDFLKQIANLANAEKRRLELEQLFAKGSSDIEAALELCQTYRSLGLNQQFVGLGMRLLNETRLPAPVILRVAQMFNDAKQYEMLQTALEKYLERGPNSLRVWVDLAAVQITRQQHDAALKTLQRAIEVGGEAVRDLARRDPRFDSIRNNENFKKIVPPIQVGVNIPLPGF